MTGHLSLMFRYPRGVRRLLLPQPTKLVTRRKLSATFPTKNNHPFGRSHKYPEPHHHPRIKQTIGKHTVDKKCNHAPGNCFSDAFRLLARQEESRDAYRLPRKPTKAYQAD